MGRRRLRRSLLVLGGLLVLLVIAMAFGISTGQKQIPVTESSRVVLEHLRVVSPPAEITDEREKIDYIVWELRVPRVLLALLAGYALSLCGGVMQGVFRNPLADPYLLGIASGATAGAATVIALGYESKVLVPVGALCGGLFAIGVVYRLSLTRLGRLSDYTLILAGVAITALFGSVTSFLIYISEGDDLKKIIFWMLGSLEGAIMDRYLAILFAVVVAGSLAVQLLSRDLNALMLGDDMATHLGIDPQTLKKILLALAAVLTAAVVSQAGIIGFVGLIVPHAMRLVLGPEHRLLLPASGLAGALFLILCDTAARTAASPLELPVGIITSIFGAPFFLYLLRRPRARGIPSAPGGGAA